MISIDKEELKDLFIATLVIAFIFSYGNLNFLLFWIVVVLTGFVFHELAHKYAAIHYGHEARFEISYAGLGFALLLKILAGVTLIVPGAVMIYKHFRLTRSKKEVAIEGVIAAAGPLTNLVIATLSLIIGRFFYYSYVFNFIAYFNTYLALFNLLPLPPLDGFKIIRWSYLVEGLMMAYSIILMVLI